jgi:malonate transporter and related proteins
MTGVLTGFAIIGAIVALGWIVGRLGTLGPHAAQALGRAAFFVFSPALLFTVLADADVAQLFSALLPVSAAASAVSILVFVLVARLVWRRSAAESTIGALASGYTNANNIGLPLAAYVLGDPALVAPVILWQLIVVAPIALTVLDVSTSGRVSAARILMQPVRNPLIIGSALGLVLAVTGIELPDPVMEPFRLLGAAAIPVVLFVLGLSLTGERLLAPGSGRRDVLLATALKLGVMPVAAWVIGAFVVGLDAQQLFTVVTLAALPAAQNVFQYAQRFDRGVVVARDAVLITTALAVPALAVIAALLAPR